MEKTRDRTSILADISLFIVAIIWGSGFIVIKNALDYMDPIYLLILRFSLSSIILALVFNKRVRKISREDIRAGTIIGSFLFIAFVSQTIGLQYTTASKSAFITASNVVMVPLIHWLATRERPDLYSMLAAVLCFIGLGILSLEGSLRIGLGDGLTLICALFFGLHIISIGRYSKNHDPILLTIIQFAVAGLLSIGLAGILRIPVQKMTGNMAWSIGYLVMANTIIAFGIQNIAQKYTTSSHAAIILSLESVFGALFSVWFLKERFTLRLFLGSLIVLLAIITSETKWSFLRKTPSQQARILERE